MERFAPRENILLGNSPQKALPMNQNTSPKSPIKYSDDIDFHDVFGGPPRQSSFTESMNSTNSTTQEEDKPVFGEETVNRRRHLSNDFFDDIFKVEESVMSSPRKPNHDPFGSSPGSRVLSPALPLPPRADPFGSSLPAQFQFSLPASVNRSSYKNKDPTSNEISTPSSPLRRLSSETFQEEDELRNEIRPSYRPSLLSNELSLSSKESPLMTKSGELESTDAGSNLKKDLKSTEVLSNSSQFHFSIYKWAGKGVPSLTPVRRGNSTKLKERVKFERWPSSNGRIESDNKANGLKTAGWFDNKANEFPYTEGGKLDRGSILKTSTENKVEPCHIVEETVLSMPGSKSINKSPNIVETVPVDAILSNKEKGIVTNMQEAQEPELKPLRSLLYNTDEGLGNAEITRKSEGKENMVKKTVVSDSKADVSKNVKKLNEKINNSNGADVIEVKEPHSLDSSKTSVDKLGRNGITGKVRDFVKLFNQDATSKPKIESKIRSQRPRRKSTGLFGADNEGNANTTQINGKDHEHSVNKWKTPPNASVMVDKNIELEKQEKKVVLGAQNSCLYQSLEDENSFGQRDTSASIFESLPDVSKVAVGKIDDIFHENFVIKELSNDQGKLLETEDGYEDIQLLDAKIRKWSNGKEGNLRSLLSTLQYILWSGSGWKPVPLVDIIEGSSVKRAYQRALLCLHPDKLQQKGAASHQKYIAEKVFDILQDAWDHFNSLGSM